MERLSGLRAVYGTRAVPCQRAGACVRLGVRPRMICLPIRASVGASTPATFSTSAAVTELLGVVQGTDSGADADVATRARITSLVDYLEQRYEKSGADPRTDPDLMGDYRVVYTSSPQAAGGRFRSTLGRALFRTHALYQNVTTTGEVANRVEFQLLGCLPGAVGLQGPFQPVEPLTVAPAEDVVMGTASRPAAEAPRSFGGAVEVRFGVPYFEIAGTRVSIGGASTVRLATTYLDSRMRLGRGGFGSLFVFEKMAEGEQAKLALSCAPAVKAAGAVLAYFGLAVYYAASSLLTAQRLAVRAAKNPAVGLPALLAAAVLAASLLAPAASASLLSAAAPPAASWAAHLGAATCWGASLALYSTLGEKGLFRDLPRKLAAPAMIQAQTRALAAAAAAGAAAAAAFAATGAAAADPAQRLVLCAALACTFLDLVWAQPLRGQLQSFMAKLEVDAGIGDAPLGAAPDAAKMTPTLERLRKRVGRWHAASGALTAAGVGLLGAHVLGYVAGRLAAGGVPL